MPPKKKENPRYVRGKYTEGVRESVNKYNSLHYDKVTLRIPKGQLEKLRTIAKNNNMSLNGMYNKALHEFISRIDKEAYENLIQTEEKEQS